MRRVEMKRVLVAGATGYLGKYVVRELKKQGYYTKVLVRNNNKLDEHGTFQEPVIRKYVDEIAIGDITKPNTIKNVCENIDYVFTSVGITNRQRGTTFKDVDLQGNVNLLKEAEQSNIKSFMYIHVFTNNVWKQPGPLIEAKEQFINILKSSIVDHIIIRPTGYFSDLTQFLMMAKKGKVYLIGNGKSKMNPIHGEDLAQFCVHSLSTKNVTLDIGGPEILTFQQMALYAFEALGKQKKTAHIPKFLLKPVSFGLKIFNNYYFGIFQFFMNVMTHDLIAPKYGKHTLKNFYKNFHKNEKAI